MTAIQFASPLTPQAQRDPESRNFIVAAIVTLVLAIVPAVVWPGDAYFMWDEPMLIGHALEFNSMHQLAERGLNGNFAIPYGPFPTQFYQLLLLITHNLAAITCMRAFASSAVLAGSMLWLSKSLRLTPWFAAAMLLAPWLSWTERTLWDATFAIPIGMLAVAAYASFLRKGCGTSLFIAIGAGVMGPLIHMQGLPLFAALAGHAVWKHWRAILKNWIGVVLVLCAITFLNWRYFHLFYDLIREHFGGMIQQGYPARKSAANVVKSFFGPLLAGHNLTGENAVVPRTGLPGSPDLAPLAVQLSEILYGFIWLGIIGCFARVVSIVRARRDGMAVSAWGTGNLTAARDGMIVVCVAGLLMQMVLAAALRVPGDPQYSFGTFPIHALFAWAGVEMLWRMRLAIRIPSNAEGAAGSKMTLLGQPWLGILPIIYAVAVAYLTIGGAWSIHRHGWPRGLLSPSINNQMEIAKELNHYSDGSIWTDVSTTARFPKSLQVLELLNPPAKDQVRVQSPHGLLLRYRPDMPPSSQVVELVELPAWCWAPTGKPLVYLKGTAEQPVTPDPKAPPMPSDMVSGPVYRLEVTPIAPTY